MDKGTTVGVTLVDGDSVETAETIAAVIRALVAESPRSRNIDKAAWALAGLIRRAEI